MGCQSSRPLIVSRMMSRSNLSLHPDGRKLISHWLRSRVIVMQASSLANSTSTSPIDSDDPPWAFTGCQSLVPSQDKVERTSLRAHPSTYFMVSRMTAESTDTNQSWPLCGYPPCTDQQHPNSAIGRPAAPCDRLAVRRSGDSRDMTSVTVVLDHDLRCESRVPPSSLRAFPNSPKSGNRPTASAPPIFVPRSLRVPISSSTWLRPIRTRLQSIGYQGSYDTPARRDPQRSWQDASA